jgi:hypothetical protein
MPPHSSHLLQLLDVSCFLLLKLAYGGEIKGLMRCYITYITKLEFLSAFKAAFYKAFTESNICAGFRATRLALFNLEAVLLKLDVVVRTPLPPALLEPTWVSHTPSNTRELHAQLTLLRDRIRRH